MRSIILIVLIGLPIASAFGQSESKEHISKFRKTEIHAGLSAHKLAHIGIRQYLGENLMLEADHGVVGFYYNVYSYNLGLGVLLNATIAEPGWYFSVNYSLLDPEGYRKPDHLLTGNIGWLAQHDGFSVLARGGIDMLGISGWFRYNLEFTIGYAFPPLIH